MLLKARPINEFIDEQRLKAYIAFETGIDINLDGKEENEIVRIPLNDAEELMVFKRWIYKDAYHYKVLLSPRTTGKYYFHLMNTSNLSDIFMTTSENCRDLYDYFPVGIRTNWLKEYFKGRRPENLTREEVKALNEFLHKKMQESYESWRRKTARRERRIKQTLERSSGTLRIGDVKYKLKRNEVICYSSEKVSKLELPIPASKLFNKEGEFTGERREILKLLRQELLKGNTIRLTIFNKRNKLMNRATVTGNKLLMSGVEFNVARIGTLVKDIIHSFETDDLKFIVPKHYQRTSRAKEKTIALEIKRGETIKLSCSLTRGDNNQYIILVDGIVFETRGYSEASRFLKHEYLTVPEIIVELSKLTGKPLTEIANQIKALIALKKV